MPLEHSSVSLTPNVPKDARRHTPFPKRTWFSPPTHKQITHQSQHHPPHTKYHKSKIPHLYSHLTMKKQTIYIFPLFLHMQHQYTITILCFKRLFTIIIFPQAAIQTKMGLSRCVTFPNGLPSKLHYKIPLSSTNSMTNQ